MKKYTGNTLVHKKGVNLVEGHTAFIEEVVVNTTDRNDISDAVQTAKTADVVVMVLGEHGFQSGEGRSRTNLDLPGLQQELLEAVYAVNKNVVLVLNNGRPLAIEWAAENIPAIVEGWQLGTQSGNAIAQVLYGDYNPSGKLPMTFPRNVGQVPIYYNHKSTGRPTNDNDNVFWSHYIDEKNTPLWPFGYGLSYTTFEYKNFKVHGDKFNIGNNIKVTVDVTNTGDYDGKEVVQLYIRDLFGSVTRPVRELKGFELVHFKKGETKTIEFTLTNKELGFFNNQGKYIVEAGDFEVFVGGSSNTILKDTFTLK
ncbi:periplasmic beta-glucosidase precursor [Kordia algicida OT-1]|uniref:Periplasmic beta-glucosidase n=1 Tax=Kordia algicida OT-1 TaxID=391587 RepID=A9DI39_9FLAO|nr:periplasmic beta-glucosidase precursor [Kordia algicida OT-1]